MFRLSTDDVVRREIESVRARQVILDQLEGGPKTGTELREAIRKDMTGQVIEKKGRRVKDEKIVVSDPKLYHNTSHLEKMGIIKSRRQSRERVFELTLHSYHPVRRALRELGVVEVETPVAFVVNMKMPDDQRPFALWLNKTKAFKPHSLMFFTEERGWKGQVLKAFDRYATRPWDIHWHSIPLEITGAYEDAQHGNIRAVYEFIQDRIVELIPTHDVVIDLSMGTPLTLLAMARIAEEYSLRAVHVENYEVDKTRIIQYYPRTSDTNAW